MLESHDPLLLTSSPESAAGGGGAYTHLSELSTVHSSPAYQAAKIHRKPHRGFKQSLTLGTALHTTQQGAECAFTGRGGEGLLLEPQCDSWPTLDRTPGASLPRGALHTRVNTSMMYAGKRDLGDLSRMSLAKGLVPVCEPEI